jgi:predicted Rossmann-fold nucleotide-binding protein
VRHESSVPRRIRTDNPYYEMARQMGAGLVRLGFTVMTGGGPGMMEAANRGAGEAGGRSVGCNINTAHRAGA